MGAASSPAAGWLGKKKNKNKKASPAPSAIYFCIKLQFGRDSQFSTIYTDIIVINNPQTCHTLVSRVFDWSALGSQLLMIRESGNSSLGPRDLQSHGSNYVA